MKMRRFLAILFAATTALGVSAVSFASAQAAPIGPVPIAGNLQIGIEQIRDRERWGGDWDRGPSDEIWRRHQRYRGYSDDGWRRHYRHHRRHRDFDDFGVFPGFYFGFGFPQAYYRPRYYQPYYGYGNCFRTWDGALICR